MGGTSPTASTISMASWSPMAVRRERIDRRLSAAAPIVLDQPADTIVVFRDGWGEVVKRYDLGSLGLPLGIAILLADAFRHHHAASSRDTQRHCWRSEEHTSELQSPDHLV